MEARSVDTEAEPENRRIASGRALCAAIGAAAGILCDFLHGWRFAREARTDWRQVSDHLLRDVGVDRDTVSDPGASWPEAEVFMRHGPWR